MSEPEPRDLHQRQRLLRAEVKRLAEEARSPNRARAEAASRVLELLLSDVQNAVAIADVARATRNMRHVRLSPRRS